MSRRAPYATVGWSLLLPMCLSGAVATPQALAPQITESIRSVARTDALRALYQPRNFEPLWVDNGGLTPGARSAVVLLRSAAADGLSSADYVDPVLVQLIADVDRAGRAEVMVLASVEVGLSAAVLRYLTDLHRGRVAPGLVGYHLSLKGDGIVLAARVSSELASGHLAETAERLRPRFAQYGALRRKLAKYRGLAADTRVTVPRLPGGLLRSGDRYDEAGQLLAFLIAVGDIPQDAARRPVEPIYQGPLVAGVEAFQRRHGLNADGVVGPRTRAALQVPLSRRVRQVELALERLRWLPDFGDRRLIAINIPMYRLWAWDAVRPDGIPALDMNVIVGKAVRTETPVLVDELEEVVFRPWWNVPRSIVRNEILPALARDPGYLRKHDMEIVGGPADGSQPSTVSPEIRAAMRRGGVGVRQRPGPQNALGLVKFVFPNDENVYMHGTPAQELFARSRRDFSHGCVRLEDPVSLAEWVLRESGDWNRGRIVEAMNGEATKAVRLLHKIPVVLFYTTAVVVPEDDAVWFAEDVYGGDVRLERALAVRRP